MNAPPPKDMDDVDPRPTSAIEAEIAKDAEHARRAVARRYPGEAGEAETDTGRSLWDALGIGKSR